MKNITNSIKEFKPVAVEDKGVIITGADNLDVLKTIPDNTVDMIYIDPPYLTNKVWEKNGWSFEDKFDDMWSFLYFLGERLIEAKRIMRTRHYQIVDDVLMEDGRVCTYEPRRDKILEDYSGKGKMKKLEKGVDVGASIFVHIDYRTNSEIKTYLMDPLFGEGKGALSWDDVQMIMENKIGERVHTPISVPAVEISQGPDIVCDFFAGSHSTAAAAWKTGRRFISIELNKTEELFYKQIEGVSFGEMRKD
jgi:hypothetical protein